MIHEQVPLPVPCYDFALLTEPTLGPLAGNLGYSQLAWRDGLEYFKVSFRSHRTSGFPASGEPYFYASAILIALFPLILFL